MDHKDHRDHKVYVTTLLKKLENDWLPAAGVLLLIEQGGVDDTMLVQIEQLLHNAIKLTHDALLKSKLESAQSIIQTIKQREAASRLDDDKELEELEAMLALL